ncbi:cytochrome P450 [Streptomyces rimosus]|uniref:cytochrome P450 n=1 Tax=Streptomyces rimosus TaxID=1927 RepID=UPI0006B29588|nr:cytochrome P450 [Streptomyces rimosus]
MTTTDITDSAMPPVIAPDRPDFYWDCEAAFRWLQRHSPVHPWVSSKGRPMHLVSRWADVRRVSGAPADFSSAHGHMIDESPGSAGGRPSDPRQDTPLLHNIDPPEHDKHRKLISRSLTARRVQRLEPAVRAVVRGVLDEISVGQETDAVSAFAAPIPLRVIAELLGVPLADVPLLGRWSDELAAVSDAAGARSRQEVLSEFFDYLEMLIAERRRSPRDDLITSLAFAELDGQRLSQPELLMHLWTSLVAGNDTTRNAIAGGVEALIANPAEYQRLVANPGMAGTATEEVLRWSTPARYGGRTAVRPVEIAGHRLRSGDYVLMLYSAANRDPEVFSDPYRFDIGRDSARMHVSFGHATHFCIGAQLARLEIRIVLEEFAARYRELSGAGPAHRSTSPMLNGYQRLPVVLHG